MVKRLWKANIPEWVQRDKHVDHWRIFLTLMLVCVAPLLALAASIPGVAAQSNTFTPIYSGFPVGTLFWTPDSHFLVYQSHDPRAFRGIRAKWHEYDIKTGILTDTDIWPLQPKLNDRERQLFPILLRYGDKQIQAFMFGSPDSRFVVYPMADDKYPDDLRHIMIGDRLCQRTYDTGATVWDVFTVPDYYNILWSRNSKTFAVVDFQEHPLQINFQYIHIGDIPSSCSQSPLITRIADRSDLIDDYDHQSSIGTVYDISDDGQQVLLSAYWRKPTDPIDKLPEGRLTVWNVEQQKDFQIEGFDVSKMIAVRFAPNDQDKIWFINDQGIVEYSIQTRQYRILNADINSLRAQYASFSPDGQWVGVSVMVDKDRVIQNVYVLRIQ